MLFIGPCFLFFFFTISYAFVEKKNLSGTGSQWKLDPVGGSIF